MPIRSPNNRITLISIAIAILVWVAAYIAISIEVNRGYEESKQQSQRVAIFFEEHTLAIFRYGDAYLKMIRKEYQSSRSIDNVQTLMEAVPLNTSIASHVTIIDETGKPLLVSGYSIKPGSTARDRDYFLQQKNAEADSLTISLPHFGRNSGILTIRLVRRLVKPDGSFGGVAFVAIRAEYITEFFNALGLGGNSSATLVGADKKIRARSSYGRLGPGQDISGSRIWREIEISPVGNYMQLSVVDGITRNYSYRVLNEFPLVVAIGVSVEDSLQALQQYKVFAYSISTLASFLIFITALLFSQEISAREKLESSEKHTRIIVDTVLDGIISIDADGCIETFSRGATKIFGYTEDEIIGRPIKRLSVGGDWFEIDSYLSAGDLESAHNPEEDVYFEVSAKRKNGEVFPIEIAIGETQRNGKPMLVITAQDISEKKRAATALFESEKRAQVTLQSIGDAVISTTADGIVEFLNPVAEKLTGWQADEAKGQPLQRIFNIIDEKSREPVLDPVALFVAKGEIITFESDIVLISRDGTEYAIENSAAPIRVEENNILGVVLVFRDVTEPRKLSQEIHYRATHDVLTELINRQEFERRLQRVRDTAEQEGSENVLCYIDLDQFKVVNDTCGHVAGDELLRQISSLMMSLVRQRDSLGRLGGDEFGLLMEHCSIKEAKRIGTKIIDSVRQHNFTWDGEYFTIGVSIGIVSILKASQNIDDLMKAADAACYTAKEKGRNRLQIFQEDDEVHAKRSGDTHWAVGIPRALQEDRFCLYYQNIRDTGNNQNDTGHHYEILLRMLDEDGKEILPGSFLPAAERYKLANDIDIWVISYMFKWLHENPSHLEKLKICAINLSALSISNESFLAFVVEQLERYAIPAHKICFEVTETVAISNLNSATRFIQALKKLGCQFALDDFGSGLSSYAYLKNLPVDMLKIDGLFVKDILDDPVDFAMVKSIHEIGRVMGQKTIAEFVENEAILKKLQEIGVDYAQGYGIHKPRPLTEMPSG